MLRRRLFGPVARCLLKQSRNTSSYEHYPVAIVGGGPSGLLLSNLLSKYDVPHVLFERLSVKERFRHPQAHFMNTRTMEILKYWLPEVFKEVQDSVPPVEQWEAFRFGVDLSQDPLARVIHPVRRPLQAECDMNGVLSQDRQPLPTRDLSTCSVGHLAQHTFGRILHNHAKVKETADIRYGCSVESIEVTKDSAIVSTLDGRIQANLVVAADGSESPIRKSFGIHMHGTLAIQHLINVHVQLCPEQARALHANNNDFMLFSVFNPEVVAMVVCHSRGDYVIQIPYFPPYMTLEEDFGPENIDRILKALFGERVSDWTIQSIKSWTMSSLVADKYIAENRVALVGDAAHVFPPAGGFGMNTGLQDAHSIAWKIAMLYQKGNLGESARLKDMLVSYENERRPIANQNAALSVRNYKRLLDVVRATYLNHDHSVMLQSLLNNSPLPMGIRQTALRSLVKTAMFPFSWLHQPKSSYASHIQECLLRVLRSGRGLPLLFPSFELEFDYNASSASNETSDDSYSGPSKVKEGRLFPHYNLKVLRDSRSDPASLPEMLSTANLPGQLSPANKPTYVCLAVLSCENDAFDLLNGVVDNETPLVAIAKDPSLYQDVHAIWLDPGDSPLADEISGSLVVIRPDGHISAISGLNESERLAALAQGLSRQTTKIL